MTFADGNAALICSSCLSFVGLSHLFRLFPKASGLNSCFRSAEGNINYVSGLYSMNPGGVNLFATGASAVLFLQQPTGSSPSLSCMQHPPSEGPQAFCAVPEEVLNVCAASSIGL